MPEVFYPTGYLFLRDGTCYRIQEGSPQWIRDPNGNMINFYYSGPLSPPYKIVDSINREYFFDYSQHLDYPNWRLNRIRFKGFGGAPRTISIFYANFGSVLRPGYSLLTMNQLFPELDGSVDRSEVLVSSVQLPNGRSYQFRYSPYRELARVTLPTCAVIDYDHEGGQLNGTASGVVGGYQMPRQGFVVNPVPEMAIYRRIVERREYPDGVTLESKTTFSKTAYGNNPAVSPFPSGPDPEESDVVVTQYEGGSGRVLTKSQHFFHRNPILTLLNPSPLSDPHWQEGKEYKTDTIDPDSSAVLKRVQNTWVDAPMPGGPRISETSTTLMDVNLIAKRTFNYDLYNNVTDVYEYGFGSEEDPGTLLRHTHTDYLTNNPDQGEVNYATNLNVHMRNLPTRQQTFNESGTEVARTTYEYDKYTGANHAPLVDLPGISAMYPGFTSAYPIRGNVTKVSRWLLPTTEISTYAQYDTAGNVVKTIDGRTPAGIATFDYSDLFGSPTGGAHTNIPPTELGQQKSYALPTKVTNALGHETHTKYDYYLGKPVDQTDPNGLDVSWGYNDPLDRLTQVINHGFTSSTKSVTTLVYYDEFNRIDIYNDLNGLSDGQLWKQSFHDGLGRTYRTSSWENETSTFSIVYTQYDALGRVHKVSNPFRRTEQHYFNPPTEAEWTTTEYDGLSRVTRVTPPDGSQITTQYDGNEVTVTDQGGKKRLSEIDAQGRLTKVTEDPGGAGYVTTYEYDALNNLLKVKQESQERLFAYNSLSQLTSATNPESGTITYKYDESGNLKEKKDARNITTKYEYDVLNRNITVDYSNTTLNPDIKRSYDNPSAGSYGKGRLWKEYSGGDATTGTDTDYTFIDSYDILGRPTVLKRQFKKNGVWSAVFTTSQTYDIPGNVKSMTYPSGHTVSYSYHQSGRLSGFSGKLGDGVNRNYSTDMKYDAAGLIKREQFGTTIPLYLRRHYNNRLQMFDIRLGTDPNPLYDSDDLQDWQIAKGSWNRGALKLYYATLDGDEVYGNGGTDNNGNLLRMDSHIQVDETDASTNFVMSIDQYTYDSLNRVKSVYERSFRKGPSGEEIYQDVFRQAFLYDQWGNRTIDQANTTGPVNKKAYEVQTATNRLEPPVGSGTMEMVYDAAGNLVTDSFTKPTLQAFDYDQENRVVEAKNGGVVVGQYAYNAGGQRTRRLVGGQETWYVYGIGGKLVAEYNANGAVGSPQKEYGYRNGRLLVVWDGSETGDRQLQWLVQDHLGSTRMVVDRSGSLAGIRRHDFLPFGEELPAGVGIRSVSNGYGGDSVRQKFTGYERDDETGLDFAQSRYYSSVQGRFAKPDSFGGRLTNPQTLNLYSYVTNNPLKWVDPTGHYKEAPQYNQQCGVKYDCVSPGSPEEKDYILDTIKTEELGPPDFGISLIPIYGSYLESRYNFETGHPYKGAFYAGMAITDIGLAKSLAMGLGKLGIKLFASEAAEEVTEIVIKDALVESGIKGNQFLDELPEVIYRAGNPNPSNLTPRAIDDGFLSFRDSLSNPYPLAPGQRPVLGIGDSFFGVNTKKLPANSVIYDNIPPGHVSVKDVSPSIIKDAVIVRGRFPK